jgi:hypothetical protein
LRRRSSALILIELLALERPRNGRCSLMRAEVAYVGMKVRVGEEHRILERRGMVGKVVGRYGGEVYVVVDVRFPDGQRRLFWPEDLEEEVSSSPRPSWWRSLMGND